MMISQSKEIITPGAAFERAARWCAMQDRSQFETMRKLREMGIDEETAGGIVARLISENYLDEQRFARAFAGGKFRQKGWGKNKIRAALRQQRVSERNINEAFAELDEDQYLKAIENTVTKKLKVLPYPDRRSRYFKTLNFAVGKGFESDLVSAVLNKILGSQDNES